MAKWWGELPHDIKVLFAVIGGFLFLLVEALVLINLGWV